MLVDLFDLYTEEIQFEKPFKASEENPTNRRIRIFLNARSRLDNQRQKRDKLLFMLSSFAAKRAYELL